MRKAFLGNGRLCVGFDNDLRLRELFWPKVGLLNHVQEGHGCGLYVWTPGRLRRVGGETWETAGAFEPGMSFKWELRDKDDGLKVTVIDSVDPYLPVWARSVEAAFDGPGDAVGLFSTQAFALGENTIGEGAAWDREARRLYHFKGPCWVAVKFGGGGGEGLREARGVVAKVRDGGVRIRPETGDLDGPVVDHGLIESAIGLRWEACASARAEYLLALGRDRREADANLDSAGDPSVVRSRTGLSWGSVPRPLLPSVQIGRAHV